MKYVSEIIFAAVICGVLARLSPEKKSGGLVKFTASVAFLGVLAAPVAGFAEDVSAFGDFIHGIYGEMEEETTDATAENTVAREICSAAVEVAAKHFGVSEDIFEVKLVFGTASDGKAYIARGEVWVKEDMPDTAAVETYFEEILGCEVTLYGK